MIEYINLLALPFMAIDLTHTINPSISTWDGCCGFSAVVKKDYADCKGIDKFRVQSFTMSAGIGTHMDAPAHCIQGAKTIDEIGLNALIAPCVVLDISKKADAGYILSTQDIEDFEQQFGTIQAGSFVIVQTGWSKHWSAPEQYRNSHRFPTIGRNAAELLLARNIVGVGIDTLSPDQPDNGFPVHRLMLGAGKYIVENIANAHNLPAIGSFVMTLPIKVEGATECPVRMIGLIPNSTSKKITSQS